MFLTSVEHLVTCCKRLEPRESNLTMTLTGEKVPDYTQGKMEDKSLISMVGAHRLELWTR